MACSLTICSSLPCTLPQRKTQFPAHYRRVTSQRSTTHRMEPATLLEDHSLSSSLFGSGLKLNTRRQREQQSRGGRGTPGVAQCSLAPVGSEVAVASALFSLATAAVIPLYTLMLVAPDRPMTKRVINSSIPWVILGALYLYLLALSWTPLTLPSMFSSKYWLPELPAITRMFSSTLTLASAWIHLLALDLYAARSVYLEGIRFNVETRHSLCLCLLFAPLGILCHSLTKVLVLHNRSQGPTEESGPDISDFSLR